MNIGHILCGEHRKTGTVLERLENREKLDAIPGSPMKTRRAMKDCWGGRLVGL